MVRYLGVTRLPDGCDQSFAAATNFRRSRVIFGSASFAVAMISHFGVGAARSFFTGRGSFRSGFDMFVVGLGVAAVGYLVGEWIVRMI